ncbi:MAG: integrase core domain-containing protein, partial [Ilumatobacteraceae bacterium]
MTDNAMVFTTRYAGGRGVRNAFEAELVKLGVIQKNSRPNHPTTCGKIERFQQTFKNWLGHQHQPATITELQALLDTFTELYNHHRPHRSLPHRSTPAVAYTTRPKATPGTRNDPHYRVDQGGSVSLRVNGRLHHIGIGRTHTGTGVILLIDELHIRII